MKTSTLNRLLITCILVGTSTMVWAGTPIEDVAAARVEKSLAQRREILEDMRQKLNQFELTENQDFDFASFMRIYAEATAHMASVEMEYGTDREMKSLAKENQASAAKANTRLHRWQEKFGKYD
ncbi:MAG TPA: hypothetical protein VJ654_19855 [Noviherbaspirillum sp.]|nr:hypothetical protein [Noviherbaspirillum sp.]